MPIIRVGFDRAAWRVNNPYSSDLCTGGTAISGGDYSGYPASNAYDNNESTFWCSSQQGTSISGIAYNGYDFGSGVTRHIRRIRMEHYGTEWAITSGKVQRSSDGSSWTDVATITMSTMAGWETFDIPTSGASRYWRVLANANLAGGYSWAEYEIEMMEAN